ncbi:MAG: Rha family transcriptional regulator [Ghiorsea sp.]
MSIATIDQGNTITSREIAELTGKQHHNVCRDIRKIIVQLINGDQDISGFREIKEKNERNQEVAIFGMSYTATMLLVSGYDVVLRNKVITRLQYLEEQQQPSLPQDFSQALRMLADEVESKKVLAIENEQQRHTIKAKDKYIVVSNEASIKAGEIKVSEFCKSHDFIDIGQNKMYGWLRDKGFLFQGSREPIQKYVNLGWFTWKPSQEKHGGKFRSSLRITPRGKVKLASLYMDSMEQGGMA